MHTCVSQFFYITNFFPYDEVIISYKFELNMEKQFPFLVTISILSMSSGKGTPVSRSYEYNGLNTETWLKIETKIKEFFSLIGDLNNDF